MTKHRRRKKNLKRSYISFTRIMRYGFENFVRNAWLSLAAILIMAITLFIVFFAIMSNQILSRTLDSIRDKVEMSIYVKNSIGDDDVQKIKQSLENMTSVVSVNYVSAEETKNEIIKKNIDNDEFIDALAEAANSLPSIFQIKVKDIDNPKELEDFVYDSKLLKSWTDEKQPPSFLSSSREAIDKIAKWAKFAEKAGVAAAIIFALIAMLVMFNTIRMAIFNRKNEIYMMRLIGAEPSFVRNPFIVEAAINGLISAIVATSLGILIFNIVKNTLAANGIEVAFLTDLIAKFWPLIYLAMIVGGIIMSSAASILATSKYLKEKY